MLKGPLFWFPFQRCCRAPFEHINGQDAIAKSSHWDAPEAQAYRSRWPSTDGREVGSKRQIIFGIELNADVTWSTMEMVIRRVTGQNVLGKQKHH